MSKYPKFKKKEIKFMFGLGGNDQKRVTVINIPESTTRVNIGKKQIVIDERLPKEKQEEEIEAQQARQEQQQQQQEQQVQQPVA